MTKILRIMLEIIEIETERLWLRQWDEGDYPAFAALNGDPRVMEYFPRPLTEAESRALARAIRKRIAENGWGFWALEEKGGEKFIGFVGLNKPSFELPCTPCMEIGWRLAYPHWGKGYATEAAQAALDVAFEALELDEVYSFTAVVNQRSQALMQRLHMIDTQQNFAHPNVPPDSPLSEHVLYRLSRARWDETREA